MMMQWVPNNLKQGSPARGFRNGDVQGTMHTNFSAVRSIRHEVGCIDLYGSREHRHFVRHIAMVHSEYVHKQETPPICSVRITVLLLAIGEMGYRRSTASQNQPTTAIVKGTIGMCDVS